MWVAAGAALWGTDTVFRAPLTQVIGPTHIVLYEHLILSLVVLPIVIRHRGVLRTLARTEWLAVLGISWIGSAAASVLFTYAIQAGNPTTAVLLQKLQPLFAMTLAWSFLGERWPRKFPYVVVGALLGGYLISFGGGNPLDPLSAVELRPALLAMAAALGWGGTTVLGRWMTPKVPFTLLTSLRVVCALPLLTLFSLMETPVVPGRRTRPATPLHGARTRIRRSDAVLPRPWSDAGVPGDGCRTGLSSDRSTSELDVSGCGDKRCSTLRIHTGVVVDRPAADRRGDGTGC